MRGQTEQENILFLEITSKAFIDLNQITCKSGVRCTTVSFGFNEIERIDP